MTAADYSFIFRSLKSGVALVSEVAYEPPIVVADASTAITIAHNEVFGEVGTIRVNCFAHLMMNVEKKKFQSAENKLQIKNDIRKLRFAYNKPIFELGCELC